MPTKNITIELDVYERLKSLKTRESESFSQVLRRALPDLRMGVSAKDLLCMVRTGGGAMRTTPEQLDEIERFHEEAKAWRDPWTL